MITAFRIEGYRAFDRFEMNSLGRVNLLVGTNNSGKTSVLEALYLLSTRGEPSSLWQLLFRRGERSIAESQVNRQDLGIEFDVSHLFHGHEINLGSKFSLAANNGKPERHLNFAIGNWPTRGENASSATIPRLALHITGNPTPPVPNLPLSRSGSLGTDALDVPGRRTVRPQPQPQYDIPPSQFITTDSLDKDGLVFLWNKVALTPNETLVLSALRFLDPSIERIAAQALPTRYFAGTNRGGFILKVKGREQPIPIGSMGDGMWRMLAMAIAITQCRGGVLLVDEIDTGLHYTVMVDMWKLVFAAAREFDVQVFATTHSADCIQSLAFAAASDESTTVTLQRIESGKAHSVPYSEAELKVAAERGIEVR